MCANCMHLTTCFMVSVTSWVIRSFSSKYEGIVIWLAVDVEERGAS